MIKNKKNIFLLETILNILSIVVIVVIQDVFSNDTQLKHFLLIDWSVVVVYLSIKIYFYNINNIKKEEAIQENLRQGNYARKTLSKIQNLCDYKTEVYKSNSYHMIIEEKEYPYFYCVHQYLYEICRNLREQIADILQVDIKYVDISLIYQYEDENWKWIIGQSSMSDSVNLEKFVQSDESFYNYIISHNNEVPILINDKSNPGRYSYDCHRRDRLYDEQGSIYGIPITFFNNEKILVNSILMISTYGVNFVNKDAGKKEIKAFKRKLSDEILPYYTSLIQAELGALYMRHNKNKVIHINEKGERFT